MWTEVERTEVERRLCGRRWRGCSLGIAVDGRGRWWMGVGGGVNVISQKKKVKRAEKERKAEKEKGIVTDGGSTQSVPKRKERWKRESGRKEERG